MDQIEHERQAAVGREFIAEFKEMCQKDNRNRIAIGVCLFIFMQMAGSNAINSYSPRSFKQIGLKGTNTGLYATGIYGLVRFIAEYIAMIYVVDRFGRTKMLMFGSALMSICMWCIGAYVYRSNTDAAHISAAYYHIVPSRKPLWHVRHPLPTHRQYALAESSRSARLLRGDVA